MAYKLTRSEKIVEEIQLGEEVLKVEIDVEKIGTKIFEVYNRLFTKQKELSNAIDNELITTTEKENVITKYGEVIIELICLIFGEENAEKILKFYENNFIEMAQQVTPFITEVVVPVVTEDLNKKQKQTDERKKQLKKYYS